MIDTGPTVLTEEVYEDLIGDAQESWYRSQTVLEEDMPPWVVYSDRQWTRTAQTGADKTSQPEHTPVSINIPDPKPGNTEYTIEVKELPEGNPFEMD